MEQTVNFRGLAASGERGVRWEEVTMRLNVKATASAAVIVTGVIAGALALSACGREADRAARPEAEVAGPSYQRASYTPRAAENTDGAVSSRRSYARDEVVAGNVAWAANRKHSSSENAQYQFGKNGADFGAGSVDAYVTRAHAFLTSPPRGVLKASRSNGDVLYYDPKANVFVVADKDGAPRTMFKPRDGMTYWTQQKDRLADGSSQRSARGSSARSGGGSGDAEG